MIQTREDDLAVLESLRSALSNDDLLHASRDGSGLLPLDGLGVGLSSGTRRSSKSSDLEEGVTSEEGDKSLSNGSCDRRRRKKGEGSEKERKREEGGRVEDGREEGMNR